MLDRLKNAGDVAQCPSNIKMSSIAPEDCATAWANAIIDPAVRNSGAKRTIHFLGRSLNHDRRAMAAKSSGRLTKPPAGAFRHQTSIDADRDGSHPGATFQVRGGDAVAATRSFFVAAFGGINDQVEAGSIVTVSGAVFRRRIRRHR
jgi:hypothetical protein